MESCSRDPIGYQDDFSLFAYVRGHALILLDPRGTQTQTATKPVITIESLGDCWDDSYAKTLEDILGHPPTAEEIKDAKTKKQVIGCRDRKGSKRCGFIFAYKFKCDCDQQVVQRVESWKKYFDQNNKEVEGPKTVIGTQPPIFVENFPDWKNGCDTHHTVSTIPPGVHTVCVIKRLTSCCGNLAGRDGLPPIKSPDPDKKLLNCSGPQTVVNISFCFNRNGETRLGVNGNENPIDIDSTK